MVLGVLVVLAGAFEARGLAAGSVFLAVLAAFGWTAFDWAALAALAAVLALAAVVGCSSSAPALPAAPVRVVLASASRAFPAAVWAPFDFVAFEAAIRAPVSYTHLTLPTTPYV